MNAPDPRSEYETARDLRLKSVEGGQWFIKGRDFHIWAETSDSFLWLHGIPGSGKTVLCATVVETLQQLCSAKSGTVCCYFFLKFDDDRKHRCEDMVKSFVLQLALSCQAIPKSLENLHASCMDWKRAPSVTELLGVASQIVDEFEDVYLVVDALDECNDRERLLTILEVISQWNRGKLRILATSRDEKDIKDTITAITTSDTHINLKSDLINGDIEAYVDQTLQVDRTLKRWRKDIEARELIRTVLVSKAKGM